MTAFVRSFVFLSDFVRSLNFVCFISFVTAITAMFYCHNLHAIVYISHIPSANLLSVHYMKVYSGFFIFFSVNQKKVFLNQSWPYEANML